MPSPGKLLPWLLGGAVGLGGILQGLHWRSSAPAGELNELSERLRLATEENEILRRENDSLRSLAQGGGELAVPGPLIDHVEKELALEFLSSPVVHRIASEELRDRVAAAFESRLGPSGIDDRAEAWKWLGWLRPDDDLLFQLTAVRTVGARGWFDEVTGEAWVTDRFDPDAVPDQAAMIRLLARILLHQHFPPPPAHPGDDAARAREALHHGAAAGCEARFLAAHARTTGFVPMKPNPEAAQWFSSLPPFLQGLATFPATEGKGLADTLHVQGTEALLKAFRNPAQTTRAILQPDQPGPPPAVLDLPTTLEEPYLAESAGQLGLRLWLATTLNDPARADSIAAAWQNDRYLLTPDGPASTAVLWDIEMQSAAAADSLEAAALSAVSTLAGPKATPASRGAILLSPLQRHLRITRPSPTRIRFIHAATEVFVKQFE